MIKSFQYRIFPSHKQSRFLFNQLVICKNLWNHLLELQIKSYKESKKHLSKFDLNNYIVSYKETYPDLKLVHSQILQNLSERLHLAFKSFFQRIKQKGTPGFPRFKSIDRLNSMTFPQSGFKLLINHNQKENRISISKVGHIKLKYHRPLEGTIKRLTIKRSSTDKWYVTFQCEGHFEKILPKTGKSIGIDMGLKTFAAFSDGNKIKNPKFFKQEEKALVKAQRVFDKVKHKHKTKIRRTKKHTVARVHERIKFKRDDFSWKESKKIVKLYDIICVEDLSIKRMMEHKKKDKDKTPKEKKQNRQRSKNMQDASWGDFLNKLSFKAEEAGKISKEVNPRNTSQTCSHCGHILEVKLELKDRVFVCPKCGLVMDRDLNASKNIERLGLQPLSETFSKEKVSA